MIEQLTKLRPALILAGVLIIGAIFGYWWGVSSVEVVDNGFWQLETSYQGIYVQSVADTYASDANDTLAAFRLSFLCQENDGLTTAFEQAELRAEQQFGPNSVKAANLAQLRTLVDAGAVQQNDQVAVCSSKLIGTLPMLGRTLAPILLVLGVLGIIAYHAFISPPVEEVSAPAVAPARPSLSRTAAPPAQEVKE